MLEITVSCFSISNSFEMELLIRLTNKIKCKIYYHYIIYFFAIINTLHTLHSRKTWCTQQLTPNTCSGLLYVNKKERPQVVKDINFSFAILFIYHIFFYLGYLRVSYLTSPSSVVFSW